MLFEKKTGHTWLSGHLLILPSPVELDFVDFDSTQTQDFEIGNACSVRRKVNRNDQCLFMQSSKI